MGVTTRMIGHYSDSKSTVTVVPRSSRDHLDRHWLFEAMVRLAVALKHDSGSDLNIQW